MINHFRGEYSWLSNMTDVEIIFANLKFSSVENAYMWAKCPWCQVEIRKEDKAEQYYQIGDKTPWTQFCLVMPANLVKKKSKELEVREDWDKVKLGIMYQLLKLKFTQEPFRSKLVATGNENIVEGNYWNDKFWGVDIKSTPNEGENWLGRLIMDIRNKLQKGKL